MGESTVVDWDLIVTRIRAGLCVPFLGAGANATGNGYQGLKLGSDVALELVSRATNIPPAELRELARISGETDLEHFSDLMGTGLQDLARVALRAQYRKDWSYFLSTIKDIIPDDKCEPSPLLQTLAKLPFKLIVTTNYDRLMERALAAEGRDYELIVQPIDGFTARRQRELTESLAAHDKLILYKLHGSFAEAGGDEPLIISEEDYIGYLRIAGVKNKGVPALVQEKIVDSTLLFLGYGLQDWDFRVIYKTLVEGLPPQKKRRSFAVQLDPSPFWVDYWGSDEKKVDIYNLDLYDFGKQLLEVNAAHAVCAFIAGDEAQGAGDGAG